MDRPAPPGVVVPIRLPANGRPLYVLVPDPSAASIEPGDRLVIETDIGIVLAEVGCPTGVEGRWPQGTTQGMRVIRIATAEDLALRRRQQEREIDAFRVGIMKVRERGLPMKLARVEQLFDGSRLVFYFTAEGRVDFRQLLKMLVKELGARIRALSRRKAAPVAPVLSAGDLVLDPARHVAERSGRDLGLTKKEFGVLEVLLSAEGRVISAEELLEKVWDENTDPFTNVVRVTIMTLRRKLGDPPLIDTVTGVGYKI